MDRACLRTAVAGALTVAVLAARADDPPTLEKVEVIGRHDDEIGVWDSASQGAVTREAIENRPLLRPGDVLETIPGMAVTQHSGDGKANQYFLRGYNLDHGTDFATWVAGMPVNMPTHAHGQGYTDLNFLIPELVSRVLFSKGPYFAENGDFASVGTARIQYVDRLPANVATLTYGSFDYVRALFAGLARSRSRQPRLRVRVPAQQRAVGTAGELQQVQRRAALCPGHAGQRLQRHRDGVLGELELDRPDRAARSRPGAGRVLRHARSDRRRQIEPLQPLGRVAAVGGQRQPGREPVRDQVEPPALLELHLLPRQPGERRPVPAERGPGRLRWRVQPDLVRALGRPARVEHRRPAAPPRPDEPGRALQHRGARAALDHARGQRDGRQRRAVFLEHDRVDALVSHHRRAALRLLPLRRVERQPGELGQDQRLASSRPSSR